MENKIKWWNWRVLKIALIVVGVISVFYIAAIRPGIVRSDCSKSSVQKAKDLLRNSDSVDSIYEVNQAYDFAYSSCVRKAGLEI